MKGVFAPFPRHMQGRMEGRKGAIMAHPPACLAPPLPPSHSLAAPPHPPGAPFPNPPPPTANRSARPIRPRSIVVRGGARRAGQGGRGGCCRRAWQASTTPGAPLARPARFRTPGAPSRSAPTPIGHRNHMSVLPSRQAVNRARVGAGTKRARRFSGAPFSQN